MKFVDFAKISVRGGRGGDGCLSFRREKFVPKGGPDGGDGGRGGDVVLLATAGSLTLADFDYKKLFQGGNGESGKGSMKTGKAGKDTIVNVPCGTIVYDEDTGEMTADLVEPGDRVIVAKGGRPGRGNAHFANSVRKAPRFAERGDDGEEFSLLLELKLIADVALVGIPNAGKSSLLSAISSARPKIAGYPFTTLSPNLGVLSVDDQKIVIADVPGLIEGAHQNRGLGILFLRHVERTRFLVHVLDLASGTPDEIIEQWRVIRKEFEEYSDLEKDENTDLLFRDDLRERPYIVLGNKLDLDAARENDAKVRSFFAGENLPYYSASALTGENIQEFIQVIADFARETARHEGPTRLVPLKTETRDLPVKRGRLRPVSIIRLEDGSGFRVVHSNLEKTVSRYNFDHEDALPRFARLVKKFQIEEKLEEMGAVKGDKVYIGDIEFDFEPDMAFATKSGNR
ncbi:MAG: GTPase ObgE [Synergistaceae bacterium]|nr:GTPase ObgE [Synergistota bacterium]NLM70613.1 GTPase ObgE [Synergistaceae bacterium]